MSTVARVGATRSMSSKSSTIGFDGALEILAEVIGVHHDGAESSIRRNLERGRLRIDIHRYASALFQDAPQNLALPRIPAEQ
jgi:hypothetical protein